MARWRRVARRVRRRSMAAMPRSVPRSAQTMSGMIEARREAAGRAVRARQAPIIPAIPAQAWRRRKTEISGGFPARMSLRATDSRVDPRESRAEAPTRRAHWVSWGGASSRTRPWATRSAKVRRRARMARTMRVMPATARIVAQTSSAWKYQGFIASLPGFSDRS